MESLTEVREYIRAQSARLDPGSRYITELLAIVDRSADVKDLEARLGASSRGEYWAGDETFARMTLAQKLLVNLITNETSLMRFETQEIGHLRSHVFPQLKAREARLLSMPCSHGEESVSLAIELLESGAERFTVQGFDIQPACIETARSGKIPLSGLPKWVLGLVDPHVMKHLRFDPGDAFVDPFGGPYDLVVCRNFLGYFTPEVLRGLLPRLVDAVLPGGWLLLDEFILKKHPSLFEPLHPSMARAADLPLFERTR